LGPSTLGDEGFIKMPGINNLATQQSNPEHMNLQHQCVGNFISCISYSWHKN